MRLELKGKFHNKTKASLILVIPGANVSKNRLSKQQKAAAKLLQFGKVPICSSRTFGLESVSAEAYSVGPWRIPLRTALV